MLSTDICAQYSRDRENRKLAVRLFWMWRKGQDYQQVKKFGSDTGQLEVPSGVKSITVKVIERPAPSVA